MYTYYFIHKYTYGLSSVLRCRYRLRRGVLYSYLFLIHTHIHIWTIAFSTFGSRIIREILSLFPLLLMKKFTEWYLSFFGVTLEPEPDSNEALKNWLLSNPGADIDDYLHNKPDRCVIK